MTERELEHLESSERRDVENSDVRTPAAECYQHFFQQPYYNMRKVKNKGATLVIFWSYLILGIYYYGGHAVATQSSNVVYFVMVVVMGLSIPLGGWLADVHYGRYRVISCSLWTMWITSVLSTTALVVTEVVSFRYTVEPPITDPPRSGQPLYSGQVPCYRLNLA